MKRKLSPEQRIDLQTGMVVLLALLTITLMSGFMDRFGSGAAAGKPAAEEPAAESGETAIVSEQGGTAEPNGLAEAVQEGIIRFHVIANSDSEEDQELKLQVRNHVITRVQTHLSELFTREMASAQQVGMELSEQQRLELTREYIGDNLELIEEWAEETVKAEGFDYPVKAELGVTWIPERTYDGIYFPAGNYEALNLVIGQGTGQNWWCVIFPPLCLIDSSEEMGRQLGEERMNALLASAGENRIVLKSRILELLKKQRDK